MTDRPWRPAAPPARVLAIRLQAMGDLAITLPYLRALCQTLPDTTVDLLTRQEVAGLPRAVGLFNRIEAIGGGRDERRQAALMTLRAPSLFLRSYDVVIDLQNNRVSRLARRAARPAAWSSFDRTSPISAGERTRLAIAAAGFPLARIEARLPLRNETAGRAILERAGWDGRPLVVLSPAGAFPTRNWPLDHYAAFARLWQSRRPAQFVVVGLRSLSSKAATLQTALGDDCLDLTGQTGAGEALAVLQQASLVLAEDCGLMHMAWASGVPTLALFGSSRHDWSAPLGAHTACLHSGDLECGACMDELCRYGDVHCLTRYTPAVVVERAEQVLAAAAAPDSRLLRVGAHDA